MVAGRGLASFFRGGLVGGHCGVTALLYYPLLHELFCLLGYLIRVVLDQEHHAVSG